MDFRGYRKISFRIIFESCRFSLFRFIFVLYSWIPKIEDIGGGRDKSKDVCLLDELKLVIGFVKVCRKGMELSGGGGGR